MRHSREDGIQGTKTWDIRWQARNRYVRQGTEDGRQEQRPKTWDIEWETKYKDVKEGTNDVIQ